MLDIATTNTSTIESFEDHSRHDVVIVLPYITEDRARLTQAVLRERTKHGGLLVLANDDKRLGFIATANAVYARTRSEYFCYLAEDVFPGCYWLEYAMATMRKSGAGLLAFSDGRFFGRIAAFGLLRREWAQTLYGGPFFYPGYASHFADTELSVIAAQTGSLVYNPNAILLEIDYEKHMHPNNADDEALYTRRAASGFDGKIPPFHPQSPSI